MKDIINFLYEVGTLKNMPRTGWQLLGIEKGDYIAAHSHRTAIIAYILAKLENVDVYKTLLIAIFHDTHEARIGDLHKVAQRYIQENYKAKEEQLENLPENLKEELLSLDRPSREYDVAKDADLIEVSLTAREMIKIGYKEAQNWIDNSRKIIKTESGKKMLNELEKVDPSEWWKGLKKIER